MVAIFRATRWTILIASEGSLSDISPLRFEEIDSRPLDRRQAA